MLSFQMSRVGYQQPPRDQNKIWKFSEVKGTLDLIRREIFPGADS